VAACVRLSASPGGAVIGNGFSKARLHDDAAGHLNGGRLREAVLACSELGKRFPDFADGWYLSSLVAERLGNRAKALDFVDRALAIDGGSALLTVRRASMLHALSRTAEAMALVKAIDLGEPDDERVSVMLAAFYAAIGCYELALPHYRLIAHRHPDSAAGWFNLAASERFLGDLDAADQAYAKGLAIEPDSGEIQYLRSGLRTQTPDANHIAELEAVLATLPEPAAMDRAYLHYTLAKEYEDIGSYESSFDHLTRGARIRRSRMDYKVGNDVRAIDAIIATYSAETMRRIGASGDPNAEPIFILGLPRAGSTLVERILSSHSAVQSAGELENFGFEMSRLTSERLAGAQGPRDAFIAASAHIDFRQLGARYVGSTRPQTGATRHFADKMPLNHLYCGLIAAALPNAKIIEVVRHPFDVIFAIYKQMFVSAYPFSYDLDEIVAYYLAYVRLMDHWHKVLPGRILRLSYETLVTDQERETHALLDWCGLPYEDNCLRFERNASACTTASAAQVRRKIYASSIGKWRNFATQLGPCLERLERHGIVDLTDQILA
jgi:tetratricopeptide (TPR) repeat protein